MRSRFFTRCIRVVLPLLALSTPLAASAQTIEKADDLARLALECIQKEYPNKIAHVLRNDADSGTPRQLYPAFYGCYDWHSAVHGHWLLVRLLQLDDQARFAAEARKKLDENLSAANLQAEAAYFQRGDRSFERPYGIAWLLQLSAQLHQWDDPDGKRWAQAMLPVEQEAANRIREWLPNLTFPVRVGEHAQTAFAFGLIRDWAVVRGDKAMQDLIDSTSRRFYLRDRDCPLAYEPSGSDFLSPCLAEADLMRRVLPQAEYATWLAAFMPQIPRGKADESWLAPGIVTDKSDGKLAHLDGLNLSRAWMLEGIIRGLPAGDERIPALQAAAKRHRAAGMAAFDDMHYMGSHWLGSFATYMLAPPGA
ncbi:hypothetical protein CO608_00020 [Lysobacteraceae bacterium NML08-0793]|nr:hypothetical protein CO608_00020 [Xanthomonadaceae bacterium NML08-0793]